METVRKSHDRTQYQGRRLLLLLFALLIPAALLYLRIVLGLAATDSRVGREASVWLARWSIIALICFFIAEILCTRYLQRLLPPAHSLAGQIAQYCAVFAACVLFSLTAAVSLEAFGFDVFLRAAGK